ncbi:MAG TPA: hypothetical protein VFV75_20455 [Candidatus Polarisedimenticolaceae bacterium]|nr:hypothetical protein [Candidatus Polarisedimenticolaceae bacterium]
MRAALLLLLVVAPACRPVMREPTRALLEDGLAGQRVAAPGARAGAAAAVVREAPGAWVAAGPRNVGGRVTSLGVDPNDPARIWVGTAAGGVFLTEDEGATFRPVFDGQTALAIGSLAVHPTDSDTVYVGTGEDTGAGYMYDGEGVFKTTDGGETWTQVGLAGTRRIGSLAVDPTDGDRVFAAAGGDWFVPGPERGIYRTLDGGQTWQRVLFVGNDAGGAEVVIDAGNPSRVFASIWQRSSEGTHWEPGGAASGIWRSLDGGDTWTRLTVGLPTGAMGKIGLALAPSAPSVVYAVITGVAGTLQGIYRSQDGGNTWEKRNNSAVEDWFGGTGYYFAEIRVDPASAQDIYALDIRLLHSGNGGRSVSTGAVGVHVDFHDLIIDPVTRRWLLAGDGGVHVSHDDGRTFTDSVGLPITQIYDLGIDAQNTSRRFAGAQDVGTLRTLTAGSDDWEEVLTNDGLQCEVDPGNGSRVYASMQAGDLHRSVDGGATFVSATAGIDLTERVQWNAPLVLDPQAPSTLYTGRTRVYRSEDAGLSWSPVSPDLTASSALSGAHTRSGQAHAVGPIRLAISALAVSPVDRDVLWAGTDSGRLWVSETRGGSWTDVSPPGVAAWITDIEPDPVDPRRAYVALNGNRTGDRAPHIRETSDLGASWADRAGDLPQAPVNALKADRDWRGRLFVGTDLGVYVSDDGGASWSVLGLGMPHVVVMDLVRHQETQTLFAATYGRSLYTYGLGQLGPADGDGDGTDNNQDCALADPGAFAVPGPVTALAVDKLPGGTTAVLSWPSLASNAGPGTAYDVARGALSFACGLAVPATTDGAVPPVGEAFVYQVRGRNACGLGPWSAAPEACP